MLGVHPYLPEGKQALLWIEEDKMSAAEKDEASK